MRGLVIAGLVLAFFGLCQLISPIPYSSMGGVGRFAGTKVSAVFAGNDARFTGALILLLGGFLLIVARRIKKPHARKRHGGESTDHVSNTPSDASGTPWEHDPDHTIGNK